MASQNPHTWVLLAQLFQFNQLPQNLTPETALALFGQKMTASVSKLEQYYQDPYSHFLLYGLKIRPVIFREWIYNFLKKRTKFYNIIQAFLFALYHFILVQSIYAFISGIFLGNVKRKTDSLETVIFCHSFFNLIGIQYLGYIYYYPIELIAKRFLHTENFIVMAIVLSILPIIGFIWSREKLGRDLYKL